MIASLPCLESFKDSQFPKGRVSFQWLDLPSYPIISPTPDVDFSHTEQPDIL